MEIELEKEMQKAQDLYSHLIGLRDSAKSKVLYDTLDKEISAYASLMCAFTVYAEKYGNNLIEQNKNWETGIAEQVIELAEKMEDPGLAEKTVSHTKKRIELLISLEEIDQLVMDQSIEIFLSAISRNYKDWKKINGNIAKNVAKIPVELLAELNPVTAVMLYAADKISTVADLAKQYQETISQFQEMDRELLIMEVHTEVMQATAKHFQACCEILDKSKR